MPTLYWIGWGVLGAFVYGAPRLLVIFGDRSGSGGPLWPHVLEFVVGLSFGAIFGAAFGPSAVSRLGIKGDELPAIAFMIGLVANPIAPVIVKLATKGILRRAGASIGGDEK